MSLAAQSQKSDAVNNKDINDLIASSPELVAELGDKKQEARMAVLSPVSVKIELPIWQSVLFEELPLPIRKNQNDLILRLFTRSPTDANRLTCNYSVRDTLMIAAGESGITKKDMEDLGAILQKTQRASRIIAVSSKYPQASIYHFLQERIRLAREEQNNVNEYVLLFQLFQNDLDKSLFQIINGHPDKYITDLCEKENLVMKVPLSAVNFITDTNIDTISELLIPLDRAEKTALDSVTSLDGLKKARVFTDAQHFFENVLWRIFYPQMEKGVEAAIRQSTRGAMSSRELVESRLSELRDHLAVWGGNNEESFDYLLSDKFMETHVPRQERTAWENTLKLLQAINKAYNHFIDFFKNRFLTRQREEEQKNALAERFLYLLSRALYGLSEAEFRQLPMKIQDMTPDKIYEIINPFLRNHRDNETGYGSDAPQLLFLKPGNGPHDIIIDKRFMLAAYGQAAAADKAHPIHRYRRDLRRRIYDIYRDSNFDYIKTTAVFKTPFVDGSRVTFKNMEPIQVRELLKGIVKAEHQSSEEYWDYLAATSSFWQFIDRILKSFGINMGVKDTPPPPPEIAFPEANADDGLIDYTRMSPPEKLEKILGGLLGSDRDNGQIFLQFMEEKYFFLFDNSPELRAYPETVLDTFIRRNVLWVIKDTYTHSGSGREETQMLYYLNPTIVKNLTKYRKGFRDKASDARHDNVFGRRALLEKAEQNLLKKKQ